MSKRIQWIDFGKGLTMLLVVIGHVSLGLRNAQAFNDYRQLLLLVIEMVYVIHMPVFFALSGYFFKFISNKLDFTRMVWKKLITLGIPYVAFSVLMFLLERFGGGSVRTPISIMSLVNIYKEPINHLWFIYVLFGIFCYVGLLSMFIKNVDMLLLISVVGYLLVNIHVVNIYMIQRVLTWTPIFVLGLKLRNIDLGKKTTFFSFLFYIIYLVIWKSFNFTTQIDYNRPGIWGVIFPVTIVLAFSIFSNIKENTNFFNYFVKYGKISLSIYMLHEPIASVFRIAMLKLGMTNLYIQWITGIIVSWYLSILIYTIMHKVAFLDFFLYPLKYLNRKTN
ncbi:MULTISPECIES: acyltransferase family protein [Bacilli]|uniref:acyltransferase family protein n=1 Tax=Bacilli TaxID=91061 RepID=UPI0015A2E3CE|nr:MULTISPECIES: acyltransferase [Bacilli]MCI1764318.1 acyltransferase [Heyndrickxia oleronia]NVZ01656.1 acyltransferase [Pediococcus pentosaceus]